MSGKDRRRRVLVHTPKPGYTSIDYGRNETKKKRAEAFEGMTKQQIIEAKLAAQREDRRLKFSKPKPVKQEIDRSDEPKLGF